MFTSMRRLLLHLILLNDSYSPSSHSIHQPFRREPVDMLEPLVESPLFIPKLGELFKASSWEILHIRTMASDNMTPSDEGSITPAINPLGSINQPSASIPAHPSADHPFSEFVRRRRVLTPHDIKGKKLGPEERNHMNLKSVLHAFSNVLQSMFSGEVKLLSTGQT